MTYEPSITAYGIAQRKLILAPHDIDWVKDSVRWYWDNKLLKHRKTAEVNTKLDVPKPDTPKPDVVKSTSVAI